jgi:hypothetical protein
VVKKSRSGGEKRVREGVGVGVGVGDEVGVVVGGRVGVRGGLGVEVNEKERKRN